MPIVLIGPSGLFISGPVALPYLAREGFAQAPAHVLKLTMADTRNHPLYQVLLRFADNVKKKTKGVVEVQVYGTGELGSQLNILTGLQTGILDLCAHTSGFIDTLFPQFQVLDLPFLFPISPARKGCLTVRSARSSPT
jgi:TRAP-type transport system periplasmic protein